MPPRGTKACLAAALSAFITFSTPAITHAGAWLQKPGELQFILNSSYYRTDHRLDNSGRSVRQPRYTKYEINPYVEYGLSDYYTLGMNVFLQHLDDNRDSRYGLGDTELFIRRKLVETRNMVVSVQPMVKLPGPQSGNGSPQLGSRNADIGASVQAGYNFNLFGRRHYAELETGYRYRFGSPGDQVIANATLGINVAPRITLMPQLFQTIRVNKSGMAQFTQSPRDDYNLTKLQLSAVYKLDEKSAVQLGVFNHIDGRNTGEGSGALLSYWVKF